MIKNKKKWIVTGIVLVVLVLVAVGVYFGGSSLVQMLQAHMGG